MSEAGPHVNGPASPTGKFIDGIDPEDPDYIKNLQRPAEVKEDLQQMENRSRVKLVLNSQAFKEELEQVVEEQIRNGPHPASLIALQQITDLLLPHSKGGLGSLARASTVIPINDLRGVESLGFAKGEKLLRCKLAALYRLVDLCGWSHGVYNHISARVNSEDEHFLLNPFGMLYSEITASSLAKVNVMGEVIEPGSTQLGISKAGFTLHSAIHQARPDIKCIVHLHTPAAVAVSAMKCGLLPLSQEALICGNISYHDYTGIFLDNREKLARDLGVHNKVMILHNHGLVACGETIEEAFHFTFNVMAACEAQVRAIPIGLDNIVLPSEEAKEQAQKVGNQGGGGVDSTGRKWKTGEMEFEALMRTLDNSGYRTGYVYKLPMVKQEKKERSNSEVEIPPTSSSFTYVFDGDYEHSKYVSPLRMAMERQKKAYKAGWLNTPNAYKKTEVEEIGTTTPKKITKWVAEGDSPNRQGGTTVKIENPNQFAPQGENPKEFRQKQKSIKKDYYEEKVSAGPQSKILEGITWDEAQKAKDGQLSGAGDQVIVVGAASKGIIQRDHQHNAVVFRQYYAANPFENMSESEIEQYQSEVQNKEKGDTSEEVITPPTNGAPVEQPPQQQQQPDSEAQDTEVDVSKLSGKTGIQMDRNKTHPSAPGPGEDTLLARMAENVVAAVIQEALAVARRGKGQQTPKGVEPRPFLLNPQSQQQSMGSQIIVDSRDTHLTNAQGPVSSAQKGEYLRHGNLEPSFDSSEEDRVGSVPLLRRDLSEGESHKGVSHKSRVSELHGTGMPEVTPEGAAGITEDELQWIEAGASDHDGVSIQLNPIQLYHGEAQGGVMKVKFSIRSTVRRRVRTRLAQGGSIEEIYAAVTNPTVHHVETDLNSVETAEFTLEQNSQGPKNLRRKTRKWKQKLQTEGGCGFRETKSASSRSAEESPQGENKENEAPPTSQGHQWNARKEELFSKPACVNSIQVEAPDVIEIDQAHNVQLALHETLVDDREMCPESKDSDVRNDTDDTQEELEQVEVRLVTPIGKDALEKDNLLFADQPARKRETRKLDRKNLPAPPPPPPPTSTRKYTKSKNKNGRAKKIPAHPPLSPVKEEFDGTVEELERMESILEEADSFEQLLISADDDVLISSRSDYSGIDEDDQEADELNLNYFTGAAPLATEEDFEVERRFPLPRIPTITVEDTDPVPESKMGLTSFVRDDTDSSEEGSEGSYNSSDMDVSEDEMSSYDYYREMLQSKVEPDITSTLYLENDQEIRKFAEKSTNLTTLVESVDNSRGDLQAKSSASQEFLGDSEIQDLVIDAFMKTRSSINVQLTKDGNVSPRKTEIEVDDIPLKKTETNADVIILHKKIETDVDHSIPLRKTVTDIDIKPLKKIETIVDDIIPPKKAETNVDDIIPPKKTATNVDDIIPLKKTETNVDDIIPLKKTETNVDDIIPLKKTETNVDDITPTKKTETNVDDIIPPKNTKTNVDDIILLKKTETNVDDIIPPQKTETNVDDIILPKKTETNVDDIIPLKKTETNVDDVIPPKKAETNVDDLYDSSEEILPSAQEKVFPEKVEAHVLKETKYKKMEVELVDLQKDDSSKRKSPYQEHLYKDEGPMQTSSPKLGRSKIEGSPFKSYPEKLGKSEETLLDIMPLEKQQSMAAKSQEMLDSSQEDLVVKTPLSRSISLGPHHKQKKKRAPARAVGTTKSKETLIDDASETPSSGGKSPWKPQAPKVVLDRYHLMKHNELMQLSSGLATFKPPPIMAYPLTTDRMPPLPDTTEVPSISDNESPATYQPHPNSPKRLKSRSSRESIPAVETTAPTPPSPKTKWVPKQRRERSHPESASSVQTNRSKNKPGHSGSAKEDDGKERRTSGRRDSDRDGHREQREELDDRDAVMSFGRRDDGKSETSSKGARRSGMREGDGSSAQYSDYYKGDKKGERGSTHLKDDRKGDTASDQKEKENERDSGRPSESSMRDRDNEYRRTDGRKKRDEGSGREEKKQKYSDNQRDDRRYDREEEEEDGRDGDNGREDRRKKQNKNSRHHKDDRGSDDRRDHRNVRRDDKNTDYHRDGRRGDRSSWYRKDDRRSDCHKDDRRDDRDGWRDYRDTDYDRNGRKGDRSSGYRKDDRSSDYHRDDRSSDYHRDDRDTDHDRDGRRGDRKSGYHRDDRKDEIGLRRDDRDSGYGKRGDSSDYDRAGTRDERSVDYSREGRKCGRESDYSDRERRDDRHSDHYRDQGDSRYQTVMKNVRNSDYRNHRQGERDSDFGRDSEREDRRRRDRRGGYDERDRKSEAGSKASSRKSGAEKSDFQKQFQEELEEKIKESQGNRQELVSKLESMSTASEKKGKHSSVIETNIDDAHSEKEERKEEPGARKIETNLDDVSFERKEAAGQGGKDQSPFDEFLSSPRIEVDVTNSPRLGRRRGGAIAPPEEKKKWKPKLERKKKPLGSSLVAVASQELRHSTGNLAVKQNLLSGSNLSLADSTHSHRSRSNSPRVFENSPEHLPPKEQMSALTGEPYCFVHPLMSKSLESLRSHGSSGRVDKVRGEGSLAGKENEPPLSHDLEKNVVEETVVTTAKSDQLELVNKKGWSPDLNEEDQTSQVQGGKWQRKDRSQRQKKSRERVYDRTGDKAIRHEKHDRTGDEATRHEKYDRTGDEVARHDVKKYERKERMSGRYEGGDQGPRLKGIGLAVSGRPEEKEDRGEDRPRARKDRKDEEKKDPRDTFIDENRRRGGDSDRQNEDKGEHDNGQHGGSGGEAFSEIDKTKKKSQKKNKETPDKDEKRESKKEKKDKIPERKTSDTLAEAEEEVKDVKKKFFRRKSSDKEGIEGESAARDKKEKEAEEKSSEQKEEEKEVKKEKWSFSRRRSSDLDEKDRKEEEESSPKEEKGKERKTKESRRKKEEMDETEEASKKGKRGFFRRRSSDLTEKDNEEEKPKQDKKEEKMKDKESRRKSNEIPDNEEGAKRDKKGFFRRKSSEVTDNNEEESVPKENKKKKKASERKNYEGSDRETEENARDERSFKRRGSKTWKEEKDRDEKDRDSYSRRKEENVSRKDFRLAETSARTDKEIKQYEKEENRKTSKRRQEKTEDLDFEAEGDSSHFDMPENPLELTVNHESDDNDAPPLPPKKGFLSMLSCVGSKSADVARRTGRDNKPLERKLSKEEEKTRDYYEEGEKKKIKKLGKDKDKKRPFYFEEPEEAPVNASAADQSFSAYDGEPSRKEEDAGEVLRTGRRYEKKSENVQQVKPLSTFLDPITSTDPFSEEDSGWLASSFDSSDLGHSRTGRWGRERMKTLDEEGEESLSSFRSSQHRNERKASTFKTFGQSEEKEDEKQKGGDNGKQLDSKVNKEHAGRRSGVVNEKRRQDSESEDTGGTRNSSSKKWEVREKRDKESGRRSRTSKSPENAEFEMRRRPEKDEPDARKSLEDENDDERTLDSLPLPPPPDPLDLSFDPPFANLNTSAPAHYSLEKGQPKHVFGPAHDRSDVLNDSYHVMSDMSFDPSMSFDTSETNYRRRHRAVSFDDGYTPTLTNPPQRVMDTSPVRRRISQTSMGNESQFSRSRSDSNPQNLLSYQPWRSKIRHRGRSMSISEMVYASGGGRPRKSHSIGEISFSSTVAGGVARRRSRTPSTGDITSRMYQPRIRSRSRTSLGDTSFGGSVAPVRQSRKAHEAEKARSIEAEAVVAPVKRSESERQPNRNPRMVEDVDRRNVERSKSDRRVMAREELGEDKPSSPAKSDTLRSTDSASGGETLEERSSKEGSPTKEHPSPSKDKKKKKKFRMPSFSSKKKNKEGKESSI